MTIRLPIIILLALGWFTVQAASTLGPTREAEPRLSSAADSKTEAKPAHRYEETEARSHWYNFFIRPAKETPKDQLAYAESLRTNGWLRSAGKEFRLLTVFWPEAPEAPQAQLNYARILDARQKWEEAFD